MKDEGINRRKYKRFSTEIGIYFDFAYDLETKINFELVDKKGDESLSRQYKAVSRNISAEGLSFVTHTHVKPNDFLHMELYLPSAKDPIHMKGEVKWCRDAPSSFEQYGLEGGQNQPVYQVGVLLSAVGDDSVAQTLHYDKEYEVNWSVVLESVFGNYKLLMGEKFKKK